MQQVLAILLGTLCSGGTSLCFGAFLLRRLHLELERTEYAALAFVTGSACYSQLVFLLSAMSLARPYVFIAVGLLAALFIICTRSNVSHTTFARFPTRWKWLFGALFACFIPSSGGQWTVQGFVTVKTAMALGVSVQRGMLALGVGDHMGNFLTPFWYVVVAGVARIDFRSFFGYGFLFAAIWFVIGIVVFTFAPC